MRVELRPSVSADFIAFLGRPSPHRVQGLTALADGEIIAIGGFLLLENGDVWATVEMTDRMREYPRALHRAGRMAMAIARRSGYRRIFASAAGERPAAVRWLESFGFQRHNGGVFVWQLAE